MPNQSSAVGDALSELPRKSGTGNMAQLPHSELQIHPASDLSYTTRQDLEDGEINDSLEEEEGGLFPSDDDYNNDHSSSVNMPVGRDSNSRSGVNEGSFHNPNFSAPPASEVNQSNNKVRRDDLSCDQVVRGYLANITLDQAKAWMHNKLLQDWSQGMANSGDPAQGTISPNWTQGPQGPILNNNLSNAVGEVNASQQSPPLVDSSQRPSGSELNSHINPQVIVRNLGAPAGVNEQPASFAGSGRGVLPPKEALCTVADTPRPSTPLPIDPSLINEHDMNLQDVYKILGVLASHINEEAQLKANKAANPRKRKRNFLEGYELFCNVMIIQLDGYTRWIYWRLYISGSIYKNLV